MSADPLYANADDLTRFIIDEIIIASKQPPHGIAGRIFGPLLKLPARRFATLMAEVDRRVALDGIVNAARWLLTQIVTGVEVHGAEHIPAQGPVLVAANHPGASGDKPATWRSIFMTGRTTASNRKRTDCGCGARPGTGRRGSIGSPRRMSS